MLNSWKHFESRSHSFVFVYICVHVHIAKLGKEIKQVKRAVKITVQVEVLKTSTFLGMII